MTCFVDTSALLNLLDRSALRHDDASAVWSELLDQTAPLVTTSLVLVETVALVQRRLGLAALRAFHEDVCPVLHVEWLAAPDYQETMATVLAAQQREISLVDWASFLTMRRLGVARCFVFDRHFAAQGFVCLPAAS